MDPRRDGAWQRADWVSVSSLRDAASVLLDLLEPGIHTLQAVLDLHDVAARVGVGNDSLIEPERPVKVLLGALNLVLFLGQPAHVPGVPKQAVAALLVTVGEEGLLAIAHRIAAPL